MFSRFATAVLAAAMMASTAQAGDAYNFVKEYVRELAALEAIRDRAEAEFAKSQSNTSAQMADCIRNGQLYQLELNTDISQLGHFKLDKPVEDAPSTIIEIYQQKLL